MISEGIFKFMLSYTLRDIFELTTHFYCFSYMGNDSMTSYKLYVCWLLKYTFLKHTLIELKSWQDKTMKCSEEKKI